MKLLNLFKPVLCGAAMLWSFASYGQGNEGIRNIPLGVLPMQYNSSFAGESEGARFNTVLTYRNTAGLYADGQMFGSHASYDQFIPALRSGIGMSLSRESDKLSPWDRSSGLYSDLVGIEGQIQGYRLSLAMAPKISIKGKYTFSPSIDFSYGTSGGEIVYIRENKDNEVTKMSSDRLQSRIGLLFNTSKYYIGTSTYVLDRLYSETGRISRSTQWLETYLQAGYTFQRSSESKFSFTPQIAWRLTPLYIAGSRLDGLDFLNAFNFTFRYKKLLGGFNNTGSHLGFQTERLRILLSTLPWRPSDARPFMNNNSSYPGAYLERNNPFSAGSLSLRYNLK